MSLEKMSIWIVQKFSQNLSLYFFSNLVCMILPVLQILVLHGISTSNWPAFSVHLSRSINNNTQFVRIWNLWRNLYTLLQKSVKEGLDPSKMFYSVCLTQSKQIKDTRLQLDATARYPNHLVQVPTWPQVFLVIYVYIRNHSVIIDFEAFLDPVFV